MKATQAYIGLGSNLGDRGAMLQFAVEALHDLSGIVVEAVSRIYETDAVGPGEQGAYLNAAALVRSELPPQALLERLLAIEQKAGRDRAGETRRWSARTLDLDLLFYGDICVEMRGLTLPHPRLHERAFVLEPLGDLAADLVHPALDMTISRLARAVRDEEAVRLWPGALAIPASS